MLLTGQQHGRLCSEMVLGRDQELLSWSVNVTASTKQHACSTNTPHVHMLVAALSLSYLNSLKPCFLEIIAALGYPGNLVQDPV